MKKFLLTLLFATSALALDYGEVATKPVKILSKPKREVSIIYTKEGYYPDKVTVFEGEEVNFFVTSTEDGPHCFMLEEHKVFLSAQKGKVTEGSDVFKNAGEYKFYCPSSKFSGKVTVLKKSSKHIAPVKRDIASEGERRPAYWTPREY